jgi:D-aminopeptidase
MTFRSLVMICAVLSASATLSAAQKPRARDLNLPIGGTPGRLDAITDVAGVEVGSTTLISGSGKLVVGQGPVRTGVTVIHPRGKANPDPVFAAWFTLNGNGEMTGTTWVQESGMLEGPVAITNTHSVGVVRDAIIQWENAQKNALQPWWLPVVAETYDGGLNDINGRAPAGRCGRGRDGNALPRLQGWDRNGVTQTSRSAGWLHGWSPGAVQLRRAS